jgi:Ser/Thr protein kinase RdoA (MazF antagonist)
VTGRRRCAASPWTGSSAISTEALLRAVTDRYGLNEPVVARRLTGGYANDVYLLDGATPPVVLHVKYPPIDVDSLAWEHRLLGALYPSVREALPPLPLLDGSTFFVHDGSPVWLVPFASGGAATADDRVAVAGLLGRLHAVDIEMAPRPGHPRLCDLPVPPLREYPAAFDPWLRRLAAARSELIDLVHAIDAGRRPASGVTHNDVFPGNVLVENGQVTAFLDWEEADIDWLVWDLASALWPFCSRDDELDIAAMAQFAPTWWRTI